MPHNAQDCKVNGLIQQRLLLRWIALAPVGGLATGSRNGDERR